MSAKTTSKKSTAAANEENNELAQKYQRKTDKQHILDNPDTYIGSIENIDNELWIFNEDTQRIESKTINCIPGLYKLFDEGIVNCRDHIIRMLQSTAENKKTVGYIKITITTSTTTEYAPGTIIMENDGNGIDIAKHPEYDIWIPEMIFANLRTSTNYNKEEKRIVGGKNGFGFKLVLIWSSYGYIETIDHTRGLKYTQSFFKNLDEISTPIITKVAKSVKPYTRVVFTPDYARLKIPGLTPDIIALFKKRIYDIASLVEQSSPENNGTSPVLTTTTPSKKVKVFYNDELVPVKNFQHYIDYYIGAKDSAKRVYESANERWEYAVALSPTHEFIHVSFVNGIATSKGGKHIDYILGQIVRKLCDYIEKKKKVRVNANSIKEQLMLFVRCDIENPAFDSQTKDFMNTPIAKFGSVCTVSDTFVEKIAKMGVMDMACSLTEAKESKQSKKTDGTKTKTIRGVANFIDANYGGTSNSKQCILILCEGLSAMSGIISGLSSEDRNVIGIYPLKGKLLNVRGEQIKKINENKEITDIKKILGLESGREYRSIDDVYTHLRYGKIMYMTDSDYDGSHIKGLCINLFHSEWVSLVRIPGFLSFMNTPILRAKKGQQTRLFYNEGEYNQWKGEVGENAKQWTIKYYKGLGTSTSTEFKEYFADKKIVDFVYTDTISDENIDMVFNKKRSDDRKGWLEKYNKHSYLDTTKHEVKYEDFIDKELIHFSTYDCARSIPNMVDGLKISLRKILYCAFKRNLTSEIKVAQFSGYVSEHSMYHHGEASLNGAIINMAQTFTGSNNIHLLEPLGQFGSRNFGGGDSASERYIYTQLSPIARALFPASDDSILQYLDDDGTMVEPEYYCPIIPFVLLNGISGIGTGFSCNIPPFHPLQVIQYIQQGLENNELFKSSQICDKDTEVVPDSPFLPYYEGFKGTIHRISKHKFAIKGVYDKIDEDTIHITELPVGTWTMPYVTYLEELADGVMDKNGKRIPPIIKDFVNLSTELVVNIKIIFPKDKLAEFSSEDLEKLLKLNTTETMSNMYLFDADSKLHKYDSVEEIIHAFYEVRMAFYNKRKSRIVKDLKYILIKLSNRAKYIQSILKEEIDLRNKTDEQVELMLQTAKFEQWGADNNYDYLIKMPMNSVTKENAAKILRECEHHDAELREIENTTTTQMWQKDLAKLEQEYYTYKQKRERVQQADYNAATTSKSGKPRSKPKAGKTQIIKGEIE